MSSRLSDSILLNGKWQRWHSRLRYKMDGSHAIFSWVAFFWGSHSACCRNVAVQSLRHVWLFATPCTAARQASLSLTISWSLLTLMPIESVMPSNHLILCHPLLLPSIFPSIRVFSNELALWIRWPKYWSFSFSISPSNEYSGWFPLGLTSLTSLLSKGLSKIFSSTQVHQTPESVLICSDSPNKEVQLRYDSLSW